MAIRKAMAIALLMVTGCGALYAEEGYDRLSRQENDSVAAALATIWSSYFTNKAVKDGEAVTQEYMRGVAQALDYGKTDDAFYEGLAQGMVINSRLNQVEEILGSNIDRERLLYYLKRAAAGNRLPFDNKSANNYLNFVTGRETHYRNHVKVNRDFLVTSAAREGVIKKPSGLLFEIITEGEGDSPTESDMVLVNYTGTLIDGTEFNATQPDKPAVFVLNETIAGFKEGMQYMKRGGKYRLIIPAELAYGDGGSSGKIEPGSTIIFDVELLDFRPAVRPN